MRPRMLHTAYKVTTTRNAYGDYIASTSTGLKCHFRHITEQVTGGGNEYVESDAMAWFEPDSGIEKRDIIAYDGEHFRVERLTKAQGLRANVQFIKVELLKYGVIS